MALALVWARSRNLLSLPLVCRHPVIENSSFEVVLRVRCFVPEDGLRYGFRNVMFLKRLEVDTHL
jgi:hypothetical protein